MGFFKKLLGLEDRAVLYCIVSGDNPREVAGKETAHRDPYLPLFTDPLNAEEWMVASGWNPGDFEIAGPLDVAALEAFVADLLANTRFRLYTVDPPPRTDWPFKVWPLAHLPEAARIVNQQR